jgi:hypothetical protein
MTMPPINSESLPEQYPKGSQDTKTCKHKQCCGHPKDARQQRTQQCTKQKRGVQHQIIPGQVRRAMILWDLFEQVVRQRSPPAAEPTRNRSNPPAMAMNAG